MSSNEAYIALKKKRTIVKGKITRINNWVEEKTKSEINLVQFELQLENLKANCKLYEQIQDSIEELENYQSFDTEDRFEIELETTELLGKIITCIKSVTPPPITNISDSSTITNTSFNAQPSPTPMVKLPEVKINPFSGKISEWATFFQLFNALITENNSLTDIQRFIYLKSFLRDEPLRIIENLPATNENFQIAINLLKKRYENQLSVLNAHFASLLDISPITKCTAQILRDFVTNLRKNLDLLKTLHHSIPELWELLLIYIFAKKVDFGTRKAFETERDIETLPNLNQFLDFLEKRAIVLENLGSIDPVVKKTSTNKVSLHSNNFSHNNSQENEFQQSRSQNNQNSTYNKTKVYCVYCNENTHKIYTCNNFKTLSFTDKMKFVNSKRLCSNCLVVGHSKFDCFSRNCFICSGKHHTLLHNSQTQSSQQSRNTNVTNHSNSSASQGQQRENRNSHDQSQQQTRSNSVNHNRQNSTVNSSNSTNRNVHALHTNITPLSSTTPKLSHVLLATAKATVVDRYGDPQPVRILLDSASQNSFVTETFVNRLGFTPYKQLLNISGISQGQTISHWVVDLVLHSNTTRFKVFNVCCAILPTITCKLPQIQLNINDIHLPEDYELSDPLFYEPSDIDMLIGADLYYDLILNDIHRLGKNLPIMQNTYLGWVIAGNTPVHSNISNSSTYCSVSTSNLNNSVSMLVQSSQNPSLENIVEKFWKIEEIPEKPILTPEDELTEEIFTSTTKILDNGRFQVNLPLITSNEHQKLGDSLTIAKKRFENLERRFQKEPTYFLTYKDFITEYIALGHGNLIPLSPVTSDLNNKYFFPHHAVVKEHSTTTKLRVVFDGSCKTTSKLSLNDIMLKGFQVQPDLYDILCRFRTFKYVLTSDIEKMYRQILINPSQTFLLNILWRDNPQQPLQCIQLRTVTYGTNCAPFLATRVLNEIASQNDTEFPLASQALSKQCYVDDILAGVDNIQDLTNLYNQLNTLLNKHGFQLHKWCSNSTTFLNQISCKQNTECSFTFDNNPNKVLGLNWNPIEDSLSITVPSISLDKIPTKRNILSCIAQCFDPLGLLTAVTVVGKLIMQQLWTLKIDWDTPITDILVLSRWQEFVTNLHLLSNLKIPRYFLTNQVITKIELHGFADASEKAYAACVYIRVLSQDNITVGLISSKSRVAPLKLVTIPRLELCAMLLLSQLVQKLVLIFENRFNFESINLWTDSQIALTWISFHASRWVTFVANRVIQIQNLTSNYHWRHISSSQNPADLPSRGVSPQNILTCDLWWNGPAFLRDINFDFTQIDQPSNIIDISEERKSSVVHMTPTFNDFWEIIFSKFSSFTKLQHTLCYILRFIHNSRYSKYKHTGPLSVDELQHSLQLIVISLQNKYFSKEKTSLLKNEFSISNTKILSLTPFLDDDKIIRVGGRLENANIPFHQKHPILLPAKDYVVNLMLKQEHRRLGHAGPQTVLYNFRTRFWPLNGLRAVKNIVKNCITCFRFRAMPSQQLMSDLPSVRVNPIHPFYNVGVDYGGPFFIKSSKRRKAPLDKAYIAIFICLVTRAIHIELVTDLSTETFIAALERFTNRRGKPFQIFCDNATNFVGASNQLNEIYQLFQNSDNVTSIYNFLSLQGIRFQFIPPRSPHWGGIWESAVKSAKYHLKRLAGDANFTYELFFTILTSVEACLNSRPLCALSDNPNDLESLTPGHFLIGHPLTTIPEKNVSAVPENRLKVWQRCEQVRQLFWKRWSIEYLNRLQNRPKWMKPLPNVKINDLVLVKEDNVPRLKWPLARITEILPGKDGKVRLVKLKTKQGEFARNITRICPLPIENSDEVQRDPCD